MRRSILYLFLSISSFNLWSQNASISGRIYSQNEAVPFASIALKNTNLGTVSNDSGYFKIEHLNYGDYEILVSHISFLGHKQSIRIDSKNNNAYIEIELQTLSSELDQIVISATRTDKRQTESPVIVNVLNSQTLNAVQACSVSEGLRFQPGLRVETDCQTCNYTQLRMNGLNGSYSQILINGRPIFSPLTGLYGLEQLPTNMLDRIEVVRGGGSALYGSNAIGGTVNIITKLPTSNSIDLQLNAQNINESANEMMFLGNASVVNNNKNAGLSLFINSRSREYYDHNGDTFSELPEIKNFSFGSNLFFKPTENQKFELNFSNINEYRYGGEMIDQATHIMQQAEEREHVVWLGGLDYQLNFNENRSSFIAYIAGQNTQRTHYTGILPDSTDGINAHLENPPYGNSLSRTFVAGTQFNNQLNGFPYGKNTITFGLEYNYDAVDDKIESYNYVIDQTTTNLGAYLQSDWSLGQHYNILVGLRGDKHNLLDQVILSPRISLLYKMKKNTQFRMTWGTGFRAPQAFDTDLHIAFAGGGVSRIALSPDLKEERSSTLNASVNYDKANDFFIYGFTAELFYTKLYNAFYQHHIGNDQYGEQYEKRNGSGAQVYGTTVEFRANYNRQVQLEAGFTFQRSLFDKAVENIDELEAKREFLRSPNNYGYAVLLLNPYGKLKATLNLVYTGQMELAHLAGAPEQLADEYVTSQSFTELSVKIAYAMKLSKIHTGVEIFGGIKNITNAYQNDFDTGKNRDSNYVYGPSLPRTFFIGIRILSI